MISPKDFASIRLRFAEEAHGTLHLSGRCRCVPCRAAQTVQFSVRMVVRSSPVLQFSSDIPA